MDALSTLAPRHGGVEEWNDAHLRLETYLRAYRLGDKWHEHELVRTIMIEAAKRKTEAPSRNATVITLETAIEMTDQWFGLVMRNAEGRASAEGRVHLLLTEAGKEWRDAFLSTDPPVEFIRAINDVSVSIGPDMHKSRMNAQQMDYGTFERIARGAFEQFEWGPVLRAFVIWLIIFLAAFTWYRQIS